MLFCFLCMFVNLVLSFSKICAFVRKCSMLGTCGTFLIYAAEGDMGALCGRGAAPPSGLSLSSHRHILGQMVGGLRFPKGGSIKGTSDSREHAP